MNFFTGKVIYVQKNPLSGLATMPCPIHYSGLGIGGIRLANFALLGRWNWKYMHETDFLWVKILNATHTKKKRDKYVLWRKLIIGTRGNIYSEI